ncbi:MAG: hypothetical protein NTY36_01355 [Deltaproteobacteria bacterium]|nr:hypothetical protein [Deltaproteobacteria bacterium]
MKAFFLWLLAKIFGPKVVAAGQAAAATYEAEDQKEQAAAVEVKAAEMQQIHAKVEAKKEQAHAQVVNATDPDAAVNQQLRDRGLVTDD